MTSYERGLIISFISHFEATIIPQVEGFFNPNRKNVSISGWLCELSPSFSHFD
jgi:hypothetical protein